MTVEHILYKQVDDLCRVLKTTDLNCCDVCIGSQVYDSGFGVQEEGMPVTQRVLLGDVPGAAVLALLQYLYTARCPLTRSLLPHVQQLADRSVITIILPLFIEFTFLKLDIFCLKMNIN